MSARVLWAELVRRYVLRGICADEAAVTLLSQLISPEISNCSEDVRLDVLGVLNVLCAA